VTRKPGKTKDERDTWTSIKSNLKRWQTAHKSEEDIERDHRDSYDLEAIEADYAGKNQAYRDALNVNKSGKNEETKRAKKEKILAGKRYKKLKDSKKDRFDTTRRQKMHEGMVYAQTVLEDWLFYQDFSNRRTRMRLLDRDLRKAVEAERLRRRTPWKFGGDGDYLDWLHSLLELYDSRDIGGQGYRQGLQGHLGNQIEKKKKGKQEAALPVVGPSELHLWTPRYRRRLVGLRPLTSDDGDGDVPDDFESNRFELDEDAIEAKRAETEKKRDTKTKDLEFDTHEARRRNEIETYKNGSRPDTSGTRVIHTSSGTVVEYRWGQIRTEYGLFISAKESSWDWRTSYDCLGPVMAGWFPETSAIRDEPEEWIEHDDNLERMDHDDEVIAPKIADEQQGGILQRGREAPDEAIEESSGAGNGNSEGRDMEENDAGGEAAPAEPVDESWETVKAAIDYPYPAREFWRAKSEFEPEHGKRKWLTTDWAEETTGRRERHTYRFQEHASPVNSPPRSPIMEEISDASIPTGFPESDHRAVDLEPRSRRKCLINPNRCRAFWSHSVKECWIPYSERPTRPEDPIMWPIQEIDAPKGIEEGGADGYVPTVGMPVYRSRLYDHYGIMFPNTSPSRDLKRPQWPRIGIRVPYEPMTIEDLRLRRDDEDETDVDPRVASAKEGGPEITEMTSDARENKRRKLGSILAKDGNRRAVYEVRSMAVPIISTPQRPWSQLDDDIATGGSSSGDDPDGGSESDNEGDLFYESYMDRSFPDGRPAPVAPPAVSLGNANPAHVAQAVVVPADSAASDDDVDHDHGDDEDEDMEDV
jgi:hypothetical protein